MGFSYPLRSGHLTDRGRKRPHNEDFVAFFEPDDPQEIEASGCLYIVADGVGGALKGERASRFAAEKVLYEYYQNPQINPAERLARALRMAGNEIYEYAQENAPSGRMATTLVAAVIRNQILTVANVGDSRVYILRNGNIRQITEDHSIVGEMVRTGAMSEEQASQAKGKNRITRSLGGEANVKVDIFDNIQLRPGDKILLCSDGLTKYASREDLTDILATGGPEENANELIEFANRNGGADNVSAIVIAIGSDEEVTDPGISRAARGNVPTQVDWETFATIPSLSTGKMIKTKPKIKREYLLIGMSGVIFLLVSSLGLWMMYLWLFSSNPEETAITLTATLGEELVVTGVLPNATIAATNVPILETTQTSTSVAPTIPANPQHTPIISEDRVTCDYRTIDRDAVILIIEKLGADTDPSQVQCSPLDNNCLYSPDKPDVVDIGWVLRIPNALKTSCIEYGELVEENSTPNQ